MTISTNVESTNKCTKSLCMCMCAFVFGNCRVRRIHTVICRDGILRVHVHVCSLVGYMYVYVHVSA